MKIYFQIQWNIINRPISEAGLNIVLAWLIALIIYVWLSIVLFTHYEYAQFIYLIVPLFFSARLATYKRQEFLKICFGDQNFHLIRFLENLLLSIPFLLFLIVYQHYLISIILFAITSSLTLTHWKSVLYFMVPTPFQKHPFEFLVGFRKAFLVIALIYSLTIIAVRVGNFNLGLFGLILGFLTSMSFYSFMEDQFHVWSHVEKPKGFLLKKIKIAIICNSLLYLPIAIMLSYFFNESIYQIWFLFSVGMFFTLYIIFIKYASFPNKIGLKESIILAVTVWFPPLMLITIPYFYFQSSRSLSKVLTRVY